MVAWRRGGREGRRVGGLRSDSHYLGGLMYLGLVAAVSTASRQRCAGDGPLAVLLKAWNCVEESPGEASRPGGAQTSSGDAA